MVEKQVVFGLFVVVFNAVGSQKVITIITLAIDLNQYNVILPRAGICKVNVGKTLYVY